MNKKYIVLALTSIYLMSPLTHAKDINAGPIWNQSDAESKCPAVCTNAGPGWKWSGQWQTIQGSFTSVCGCNEPPHEEHELHELHETKEIPKQCITGAFGEQACGYNCVKDKMEVPHCADSPKKQCITGAFGETACGYNCSKDAFETPHCSNNP